MPISDLSLIEERIVRLVLAGRGLDDVAAELGTGRPLVSWHLSQACRKLERVSGLHARLTRALLEEPSSVGSDAPTDTREPGATRSTRTHAADAESSVAGNVNT